MQATLLALLGSSIVSDMLLRRAINIVERSAGYLVATKTILPYYETLRLENIISQFITDKETRSKLIALMRSDPALRRTSDFIEFLKEFNVTIAKKSLKMGIISPSWGHQTSQLLNAIAWSFGFGWLSWIGLSPILNNLIANPASDTLEQAFPRRFLTKSEIEKLYKQQIIDEKTYRTLMRALGYTDFAIDYTLKLITNEKVEKDRELSKSEILRAYRENILSRDDVVIKLRALGYSDEEIEVLLKLYKDLRETEDKKKERDLTTTQILRAYKLNLISREELRDYLKKLGYDDKEIELLIKIYTAEKELSKHEKSRELSKSEIVNAFLLELISYEDAKQRLISLGYDEDEAELILSIAYLKRAGVKSEQSQR